MTDEIWNYLSYDTLIKDRICTFGVIVESEAVTWSHIAVMSNCLLMMSLPS